MWYSKIEERTEAVFSKNRRTERTPRRTDGSARRIEKGANRLSGFGGKQMIDPYSQIEPAEDMPAGMTIGVFAAACKECEKTERTPRAAWKTYTA